MLTEPWYWLRRLQNLQHAVQWHEGRGEMEGWTTSTTPDAWWIMRRRRPVRRAVGKRKRPGLTKRWRRGSRPVCRALITCRKACAAQVRAERDVAWRRCARVIERQQDQSTTGEATTFTDEQYQFGRYRQALHDLPSKQPASRTGGGEDDPLYRGPAEPVLPAKA